MAIASTARKDMSVIEKNIYESMKHDSVPEEWAKDSFARFTSTVTVSVIEAFRRNPELLTDLLSDTTYSQR